MTQIPDNKRYDLEETMLIFASDYERFAKKLSRVVSNLEDGKQLVRSSGPVAANYIEANETLNKKDFLHRIKICKKEAKESRLCSRLVDCSNKNDLVK